MQSARTDVDRFLRSRLISERPRDLDASPHKRARANTRAELGRFPARKILHRPTRRVAPLNAYPGFSQCVIQVSPSVGESALAKLSLKKPVVDAQLGFCADERKYLSRSLG